jgi:FkbM family methyltransferase
MSISSDWGKLALRFGELLPRSLVSGYLGWATLAGVLRSLNVNCVLDVGANRGQFAIGLRRIGFRGHIVSFEPIAGDFAALSQVFRNDPFWKGYNLALGAEPGKLPFHIAVESTAMSSFHAPLNDDWRLLTELVDMVRLDSIFDRIVDGIGSPRVFLKMDTQGYDLEVFKGADGCLDDILGLQSEVSAHAIYENMPHYLDAIQHYEKSGYRLMGLTEVFREPQRGEIMEMNCVMARLD